MSKKSTNSKNPISNLSSKHNKDDAPKDDLNKDYSEISQLLKVLQSNVQNFVSTTGNIIDSSAAPVVLSTLFESQMQNFTVRDNVANKMDNEFDVSQDERKRSNIEMNLSNDGKERAIRPKLYSEYQHQNKRQNTINEGNRSTLMLGDEATSEANDPLIFL